MAQTHEQAGLSTYAPDTDSVSVTRTVVLPLETSQQKTETVVDGIEEYQAMLSYLGDVAPSFGRFGWSPMNRAFYRNVNREFDRTLKSNAVEEACRKVAESFEGWRSSGMPGDRPEFGDGDYLGVRGKDLTLVENDRGYGVKVSFIPYNPVWFHINASSYHRDFLARIVDEEDDARAGSAEIHHDGGELTLHLTLTWDVDVYEPADVSTTVGVDLGENVLYAAAVVGSNGVEAVEMESGREYRHTREQIKRSRKQASEKGDLSGVKDARHAYENYTDHITNVASREVVDLAVKHRPAVIRLEDLTDYRTTAADPIHDWPYAEIQEKIAYKATGEGIPVQMVNPAQTSTTCRKCGTQHPASRQGPDFECMDCGYEVHADVNAAMNLAQRQP